MGTNSVRARQQIRNGNHANHWMQHLLALLKSDHAAYSFDEFGIARLSPPSDLSTELSVAVHLKTLVTQCDHVQQITDTGSVIYGRVRLRDLVEGKPDGAVYVSMIVRSDGVVSFDGSTDVRLPLSQAGGYETQFCHAFAEAALVAVHDSLDSIK